VNICDETPMTTVVETSHVVGTQHTDGLTLAYLPKYCEASSETFRADDRTIYERFTAMLRKLVPDFTEEDIVDWTVQRAPLVEPVHARGHAPRTAPIWPGVEGLGLASASQVYPRLLNGDSIVGLAEQVAVETSERLGLPGTPAAAPLAAAA
jgi:protoporphyrinogen oxidase